VRKTVCALVVIILVLIWVMRRPYVPTFTPDTETLFCHTDGSDTMEIGIRSIQYADHRVALMRLAIKDEDEYRRICDAWLKIDEEISK
jgi:hypothetical protein